MRYIFVTNERDEPEALAARLLAVMGEEGKEEIMTAGEKLMERGREQGIKLGRCEMLLDQLRERFGALPDAVIARVSAAGVTELQVWGKRVLSARGLDEVFAGG